VTKRRYGCRNGCDPGTVDGAEGAGRIASFAGGKLTIALFNGEQVSGDDEQGQQAGCDASLLTANQVLQQAELKATAGGLVFREIELVRQAPTRRRGGPRGATDRARRSACRRRPAPRDRATRR
jgi:hypothetical protein